MDYISFGILLLAFGISIFQITYKKFVAYPHNTFFITGYIFYMLLFPFLLLIGLIDYTVFAQNEIQYSLFVSLVGLCAYILSNNGIGLPNRKTTTNLSNGYGFTNISLGKDGRLLLLLIIFILFILKINYINLGIIFISCASVMLNINRSYRENIIVLLIFLIVGIFIMIIGTSARRDLLGVFIVWLVLLHNMHRGADNKDILKSIMILFTCLVGLIYVTIIRSFDMEYSYWYYTMKMYNTYGGLVGSFLTLADFAIAYDNFLKIIEKTTTDGFLGIQSFYRILLIPIPREILPSKPVDVQQLVVDMGYASNIFAGGTSQSMTLIGELYWNYGIYIVFLGMYLFGLINAYLDQLFRSESKVGVVFSLSFIPISFLVWRGAFTTTIVYGLSTSFLSVLIIIFILKVQRRFSLNGE